MSYRELLSLLACSLKLKTKAKILICGVKKMYFNILMVVIVIYYVVYIILMC